MSPSVILKAFLHFEIENIWYFVWK